MVVGKWIRLWYEYVIKGLEKKDFFFDDRKANKAIRFVETFAHHHEGELAPSLVKLELWQKAVLSVLFGIVDNTGARQFREAVIIVARKNGKTLFAAAIAEYMTFLDGEYGARTYFVAPKLQQANLCFDAFHHMIMHEPELDEISQKRRTDIYVPSTNSSAQPLAFNANKSDGLNISFCVADEISSWKGMQGIKFYEVLKSSFGSRRQPLLLSISTAGYENDGIYDELIRRCTRVLLGDSKETRLAPFLYMIDEVDKWDDINELRKANPNLGVSVSVDYLLEEIAIAEGSLSRKAEFITKYGCRKQNTSTAWLSTQVVSKCMGKELRIEDFAHSYCVGGIDLSMSRDLTSACVVIERNGILHVFSKCWLPSEKIDEATERDGVPYRIYIERGWLEPSGENFIDYKDCYRWFVDLVEKYEILPLVIGYDRYCSQFLCGKNGMLESYGFRLDDVFQGDNLWPTLQFMEGYAEDGKLQIGDNDLIKAHLLNSAIKMSVERGRGRLVKISPNAHIDCTASLADALVVRDKYYSEIGVQLKNER